MRREICSSSNPEEILNFIGEKTSDQRDTNFCNHYKLRYIESGIFHILFCYNCKIVSRAESLEEYQLGFFIENNRLDNSIFEFLMFFEEKSIQIDKISISNSNKFLCKANVHQNGNFSHLLFYKFVRNNKTKTSFYKIYCEKCHLCFSEHFNYRDAVTNFSRLLKKQIHE